MNFLWVHLGMNAWQGENVFFFCIIVHTLTLHTTEHYISTYLEKGLSFQLYNYYLIT